MGEIIALVLFAVLWGLSFYFGFSVGYDEGEERGMIASQIIEPEIDDCFSLIDFNMIHNNTEYICIPDFKARCYDDEHINYTYDGVNFKRIE